MAFSRMKVFEMIIKSIYWRMLNISRDIFIWRFKVTPKGVTIFGINKF